MKLKKDELSMRQIIIKPGKDGFWLAECPSLPGCISQGQSKKDAIQNIREAIAGYIEVLKQDGNPIPDDNMEASIIAI